MKTINLVRDTIGYIEDDKINEDLYNLGDKGREELIRRVDTELLFDCEFNDFVYDCIVKHVKETIEVLKEKEEFKNE